MSDREIGLLAPEREPRWVDVLQFSPRREKEGRKGRTRRSEKMRGTHTRASSV